MRTRICFVIFASLVTLASSCGGNDPFQALGDPSQGTAINLNLPVDPNLISTVTPFSTTPNFDGIGITYNASFGATATVSAPGPGLVINVDPTLNPGFIAVTIYHNAWLTSRLAFLQSSTIVRQGDFVNAGDPIATIPSSGFGQQGIKLSVFVDGSPSAVCPFSYLSQSARAAFISKFNTGGGAAPCFN